MALDNTKTITNVTYNGNEFPIARGGAAVPQFINSTMLREMN